MGWRELRDKYGGSGSNAEKLNRALRAEIPGASHLLEASQILHREADRPGPQRTAEDVREIGAAAALVDATLDNLRAGVKRRWSIGVDGPADAPGPRPAPVALARPAPVPTTAEMGSHREWAPSAAIVERMGAVADEVLARECGVAPATIADRRRRLGIPAHEQDKAAVEWTAEMDAMIGTQPDGDLANIWGVSGEAVRRRRLKLGVPAGRAKVEWTEGRLRLLAGEADNAVAAEKLALTVAAVKTARSRYKQAIARLRSQ